MKKLKKQVHVNNTSNADSSNIDTLTNGIVNLSGIGLGYMAGTGVAMVLGPTLPIAALAAGAAIGAYETENHPVLGAVSGAVAASKVTTKQIGLLGGKYGYQFAKWLEGPSIESLQQAIRETYSGSSSDFFDQHY
jgi:hypothetical protein